MADAEVPSCGCYVIATDDSGYYQQFIPLTNVEAHTTIQATASHTRLTQLFLNPDPGKALDKLHYVFPLYDGVSVVSFVCTVGDRVIRGIVQERHEAQETYYQAVSSGKVAGLFQQSLAASDVFSTSIGNVPAGAQVKVEITYLAELKHDAEVDGIRFTLPTHIAPRYGENSSLHSSNVVTQGSISITVDADMPNGCPIASVQSPSHPISVQIGRCSTSADTHEPSPQRASASLALGSAELDKDFILQIVAPKIKEPSAFLETHATLPNQQAIMATLVPKFNIPSEKPEIVFVCDLSGSMYDGKKIPNLQNALNIFLRSLPIGVKFNICCFGSRYDFLWPESRAYDEASLKAAVELVGTFENADYGGTEMYNPLKDAFDRRQSGMNLEVFVLTDGDIWEQGQLLTLINEYVTKTSGAIRLFTLGIGRDASHSLIEGTARAGNGFAQSVLSDEKMDSKVIRMLKGALSPHIRDYTLEVKYERASPDTDDEDFVLVEKTLDSLAIETTELKPKEDPAPAQKTIPLYDDSANDDIGAMIDAQKQIDAERLALLPELSTPKYLQTPCPVPTLFPFNRTTVYVLFSESSASLVPKSIILKGTSEYGILEQEIPVTTLPGKGTVIHQLAARKEVLELEEGRGWLPMAKDAATGSLVKEKFKDQWVDIVKREAVRICLRYQVAGEHCSLVAVEEDQDTTGDGAQRVMAQPVWYDGAEECDEEDIGEDEDEDMGFGFFDGYSERQVHSAAVDTTPAVSPKDTSILQTIASLQLFTGSWAWDEAALLEGVVGVKKDDAARKAGEAGLDKEKDTVLATLCALVFLKTKLAEEKDAWEMMAEKAADWVTEQVGGTEEYERWEKVVRALF